MTQVFTVRLRGSSFENADGTHRQDLIARCKKGERLTLVAEPDHAHDRNAVAVLNSHGQQLGYLPSDARDASDILRGQEVRAVVETRIGGPRWWHKFLGIDRHYGLLIKLQKGEPDWGKFNAHRDKVIGVDQLVKEAIATERTQGPTDATIEAYQAALAAVIQINREDPTAAAHRYQKAPINRLTMLLVKQKRVDEAKRTYRQWSAVEDPLGLSKTDREALAKRMAKIGAL